jgi:hypothetical protein
MSTITATLNNEPVYSTHFLYLFIYVRGTTACGHLRDQHDKNCRNDAITGEKKKLNR